MVNYLDDFVCDVTCEEYYDDTLFYDDYIYGFYADCGEVDSADFFDGFEGDAD